MKLPCPLFFLMASIFNGALSLSIEHMRYHHAIKARSVAILTVTEMAPVIVYADEQGVPFSTSFPQPTPNSIIQSKDDKSLDNNLIQSCQSQTEVVSIPEKVLNGNISLQSTATESTFITTSALEPSKASNSRLDDVKLGSVTSHPVPDGAEVTSSIPRESSSSRNSMSSTPTPIDAKPSERITHTPTSAPISDSQLTGGPPVIQPAVDITSTQADTSSSTQSSHGHSESQESATNKATLETSIPSNNEFSGNTENANQNDALFRGRGISYSPYNADGTCKDKQSVTEDINKIKGYSYLRIYGNDCDQLNKVLPAAKQNGFQVMGGIFYLDEGEGSKSFKSEIKSLKDYGAEHGWDSLVALTVGNEDLNFGRASAGLVLDRLNETRSLLREAGFGAPVAHVDTLHGFTRFPESCRQSDFVAVNLHPWFAGRAASAAGEFLLEQVEQIKKTCGHDKHVVIAETGWPHQGISHDNAVASREEQRIAIESIKNSFKDDIFLFSAYDDKWKKDDSSTLGAERYWGLN